MQCPRSANMEDPRNMLLLLLFRCIRENQPGRKAHQLTFVPLVGCISITSTPQHASKESISDPAMPSYRARLWRIRRNINQFGQHRSYHPSTLHSEGAAGKSVRQNAEDTLEVVLLRRYLRRTFGKRRFRDDSFHSTPTLSNANKTDG